MNKTNHKMLYLSIKVETGAEAATVVQVVGLPQGNEHPPHPAALATLTARFRFVTWTQPRAVLSTFLSNLAVSKFRK